MKCTHCHNEKLEADFRLRYYKSGKSYFNQPCKECERKNCRELYKRKREDRLNRRREYRANNLDKVLVATKRWRDSNKEHVSEYNEQYSRKNRKKLTEARKIYAKKNPEQYRAYDRIHAEKRRARKHEVECNFTQNDWNGLVGYFGNKCVYCGQEKKLTQDHFIALCYGGEHTRNNIVCACGFCNTSKHKKNFFIWYPKQSFYSEEREKEILRYLNYNSQTQTQQLRLVI